MTEELIDEVYELLHAGLQIHEVARKLNVDIDDVEVLVFGFPGSSLDNYDPHEDIGLL